MIKKPVPVQGLQDAFPPDFGQGGGLDQNLAIQQAGDQRDFGTQNFLGGVGGVNAHGIQTMLDASGAGTPGMKMGGSVGMSNSPMNSFGQFQAEADTNPALAALRGMHDTPPAQNPQAGGANKEQELRQRRARMMNQQPYAGR